MANDRDRAAVEQWRIKQLLHQAKIDIRHLTEKQTYAVYLTLRWHGAAAAGAEANQYRKEHKHGKPAA